MFDASRLSDLRQYFALAAAPKLQVRSGITRWLCLGAAAAAVYNLGSVCQPTVVLGSSMEPSLHSGQVVWVDRLCYRRRPPMRGEVVVFRLEKQTYVKRVYRGPGESLYYLGTATDLMTPVRASYASEISRRYGYKGRILHVNTLRVPTDCVFVLGDNPARSVDSRQLGPIPISSILGRVRGERDVRRCLSSEISRPRNRRPERSPGDRPPGERAGTPRSGLPARERDTIPTAIQPRSGPALPPVSLSPLDQPKAPPLSSPVY